jgi:hypothetical protein
MIFLCECLQWWQEERETKHTSEPANHNVTSTFGHTVNESSFVRVVLDELVVVSDTCGIIVDVKAPDIFLVISGIIAVCSLG